MIFITLVFFFFLIAFYYFFLGNVSKFVVISENKDPFYIIPEDRGGQKVENLDKKSLNLKSSETINDEINFPNDLLYSIQIYSDTEYGNVNNYLNFHILIQNMEM